jgi:hypothetical protein
MNTLSWKNATPEQKNFWNLTKIRLVGWNTITPLFFGGAIAASEFLIYDAAKLYIALELEITGQVVTATVGSITFYNEANVAGRVMTNESLAWDVTAAAFKMQTNPIMLKNQYFGRIVVTQYASMKFNGYRLNII